MFAQVWEGELCGLPALDKLRLELAFTAAVLKADSSLLWEHSGPWQYASQTVTNSPPHTSLFLEFSCFEASSHLLAHFLWCLVLMILPGGMGSWLLIL